MRILFSSQATVQYDGHNYYSSAINIFYKRYLKEQDDIYILCHVLNTDSISMKIIDNPRVHIIDINKINSVNRIISNNIAGVVREQVQKADFCILHIPAIHSFYAIDYANSIDKPFITVVVGCAWDAYWNYGLAGKFIAFPLFMWMRRCQKKAKYSIYVTKEFLEKRYPTKGKYIACSNVNIKVTDKSILDARLKHIEDLYNTKRHLRLVTAAAIDVPYKGQQYVIKAIAILKRKGIILDYYIAGTGSRDRLYNLAKALDVLGQVHFCGLLNEEQILKLMDDSDIYVQPSKQEGLPRSVIEAMSRGLLCLGSNIAGIPELLDPKYLFLKGNSKQIASILYRIKREDLITAAALNAERAKSYDKEFLNQMRNSFIDDFRNINKC